MHRLRTHLLQLWAIVRRDFLSEFSSRWTILFFIVLPLLFTAAVGAGLGGMMGRGDDPEAPQEIEMHVWVVDEDGGPLAEVLLQTLVQTNVVSERVDRLPEDGFGLTIPAGFSDFLAGEPVRLELRLRGDSSGSQAVEQAVRVAVSRLNTAGRVAQAALERARQDGLVAPAEEAAFGAELLSETLQAVQDPPAVAEVQWENGIELDTSLNMASNTEQASAGQIVTWVQITLLGTVEVLVGERLGGTLRRMLIMPASRSVVLVGKLLGRLLLGLLQMTIMLVGGALLFGVQWGQDPAAVALVSFAFALATASLGMLLATVVRTSGQASSLVVGLSMGMAALGGAWYPLEITPLLYRQAVQILPSTWAMRAYTDLLARDAGLEGILGEAGVLFGFAALFIVLGAIRLRRYQ